MKPINGNIVIEAVIGKLKFGMRSNDRNVITSFCNAGISLALKTSIPPT
ncbi:MAG: hypothetical protein HC930_12855 [Hydrococcus sp. SU_1_0]|nr:hypothetical protein [Hydrococcus sp. SU_1_0]